MKIGIRHQESYSRGELLLRSFFGIFYIIIPHGIVLMFLGIGFFFTSFIAFLSILFTGKFPRGMFDFQIKFLKWRMRVGSRIANLCDGYPAFGLDAEDPKIVLEVKYPESSSRGLALARLFLGIFYVFIPHGLCLAFLGIGAIFVLIAAWFAILFTGKYPINLHNYMTSLIRWGLRVGMYMLCLTDTYPPFNGKETEPINWSQTLPAEGQPAV